MEKVYHFNAWRSIDLPMKTTDGNGNVYRSGDDYPETIKGERFHRFLDMCFKEATSFSLQKGGWQRFDNSALEKELEPYELPGVQSMKGFGWNLSTLPDEYAGTTRQKLYRASGETKNILKRYFNEIFLGHACDEMKSMKYTLEDLCFFKGEKLFVGSISHEYRLYVYPPNEAFENEMNQLAIWEDVSRHLGELTIHSFM